MDLNTVVDVVSPAGPGDWRAGDAWLGGGTALFAAPDPAVTRLLDLAAAGWPPLTVRPDGLEIAATCTIAELASQPHPLFTQCANSLLASFKVWNVATVGGNIALSLPAGPMTSLAVALDATLVLWTATSSRSEEHTSELQSQ